MRFKGEDKSFDYDVVVKNEDSAAEVLQRSLMEVLPRSSKTKSIFSSSTCVYLADGSRYPDKGSILEFATSCGELREIVRQLNPKATCVRLHSKIC